MPHVKVNDISMYYEIRDEREGEANSEEDEPLVLIMGLAADI